MNYTRILNNNEIFFINNIVILDIFIYDALNHVKSR